MLDPNYKSQESSHLLLRARSLLARFKVHSIRCIVVTVIVADCSGEIISNLQNNPKKNHTLCERLSLLARFMAMAHGIVGGEALDLTTNQSKKTHSQCTRRFLP